MNCIQQENNGYRTKDKESSIFLKIESIIKLYFSIRNGYAPIMTPILLFSFYQAYISYSQEYWKEDYETCYEMNKK